MLCRIYAIIGLVFLYLYVLSNYQSHSFYFFDSSLETTSQILIKCQHSSWHTEKSILKKKLFQTY